MYRRSFFEFNKLLLILRHITWLILVFIISMYCFNFFLISTTRPPDGLPNSENFSAGQCTATKSSNFIVKSKLGRVKVSPKHAMSKEPINSQMSGKVSLSKRLSTFHVRALIPPARPMPSDLSSVDSSPSLTRTESGLLLNGTWLELCLFSAEPSLV